MSTRNGNRRRIPAQTIVGATLICLVVVCSVFAPWIASYPPNTSSVNILQAPSAEHLLGTDGLGRDVLSRILHGGQVSIAIGIGAAITATLIGVPLGLCAGFLGGRVDTFISYFINIFIALPGLIVALIITAMVGPSLVNLIFILGFVNWPQLARMVRGQTLALRERMFVEAALSAGASPAWVIRHHIEPNTRSLVWSQFALTVATAIFTSSSLSFLGLGIPAPQADWGGMVRSGTDFLAINPAAALAPSVCVGITILGFYLIRAPGR
jgi:peptide/nickel transport system permease protein